MNRLKLDSSPNPRPSSVVKEVGSHIERFEKFVRPQIFEQIGKSVDVYITRLQYEAVKSGTNKVAQAKIVDHLEKMNVGLVAKLNSCVRDCLDAELAQICQNMAQNTLGAVKEKDMQ